MAVSARAARLTSGTILRSRRGKQLRKEVFILTPEPPEVIGGMQTFLRAQIRGFEEHGYAVRVFHRGNSGCTSLLRAVQRISNYLADPFVGLVVGRAAQRAIHENVLAVVSDSVVGWYPLHLPARCKLLHFHHGTYRGYAEVNRKHISRLGYLKMKWWDSMVLENLSVRHKLVLCNSGQTAQEVLRFYGQPSQVVPLIANFDYAPLDQTECRRKLDLPLDSRVGVFVGSIHPMKNFPIVRALVEALPDVHWLIALRGEIPEHRFPHSNVRIFRDALPSALRVIYSAANFSLCPSLYEPFGYVVAEALACGTPVVAAPGGASSLFLSEPPLDQLLVSSSTDPKPFVEAALRVLAKPDFYRRYVLEHVRPRIVELMSPENWWRRFFEVTGLPDLSSTFNGFIRD